MDVKPPRILCVAESARTGTSPENALHAYFDCTCVDSALAALHAMEADDSYAAIIVDEVMPAGSGLELLRTVKQRWPQTARVMLTPDADIDTAIAVLHDDTVYRLVRKPWQADQLARSVREACSHHGHTSTERHLREQLARVNATLDDKVRDLDEANELLEYWVEHSPAVLYSLSCEAGNIRPSYISKNFVRLCGYERTAAVIDPAFWSQLIVDPDRVHYQRAVDELSTGASTFAVLEYGIRHKSGEICRVLDALRAIHDGDARTVEIVGAWTDVSTRR